VLAAERVIRGGETITLNLGTGTGSSVAEVVAAVEAATGRRVPRVLEDRRPGDPPAVWADPTRAEMTLGWRATRGLREIIESAVAWHQGHLHGFRDARPPQR